MNVFTTDHPLTTQTSCFDRKAYPWLSFWFQGLVLALALLPFAAGLILYLIATDDCYGPLEDSPGLIDFGIAILVYCLLLGFLCVAGFRLSGWIFRTNRPPSLSAGW